MKWIEKIWKIFLSKYNNLIIIDLKNGRKTKKNIPEKKIFNFYYDLYCQKITVYQGTPSNEIISTLRDILQIPSEAKLEYLDEDGYPIVISSALPNEIKIYVKIKKTFTEKFIESQKNNNSNNNKNTQIEN